MATDPHRHKVVALLHFDGEDDATSITDETGRVWSRAGTGAFLSSEQKKFGPTGLKNTNVGSDFNTAPGILTDTDLFTVEGWVYLLGAPFSEPSVTKEHPLVSQGKASAYGAFGLLIRWSDMKLSFDFRGGTSGAGAAVGTTTVALSTWYHFAATWDGVTHRGFLNGAIEYAVNKSFGWKNTGQPLRVGRITEDSPIWDRAINGYIDEVRITKGVARYTSNFTPPDAPFSITGPTVQGVVQIGDPPAPAARKVVLVRARDLLVVGSANSDAVTGAYSAVDTDADIGDALMGIAYPDYGDARKGSTNYAIGDRTFPAVPTGHWYECESAGTTGTTEPVWPTDGSTVTDGTVVWRDKGLMEEPIARGPYVVPPD